MHVEVFFQKRNPLKLSCSPDPTTNSETTNPNFQKKNYQLQQLSQVFFVNINLIAIIYLKIQDYNFQN